MDFLNDDYDYREGIPQKMEISDWKSHCDTELKAGKNGTRVSGTYSVLLIKNSALPLQIMELGFGMETAMCESHNLLSIMIHAVCGLTWLELHDRLSVAENNVLSIFSLPTLNLIMQGAFELLQDLREETLTLKQLDARARTIGVNLREQMGYNPFKNPRLYHQAYQTNWGK